MKYIYKGLARPEIGASAVLLGWHDKVCGSMFLGASEAGPGQAYLLTLPPPCIVLPTSSPSWRGQGVLCAC